MKRLLTIVLSTVAINAMAQLSTVSINKPLGFFNPAMQNYDYDKVVVSASAEINPFVQDKPETNHLIIAETKTEKGLTFGAVASKVDNRLSQTNYYKGYVSYRIELETENYLILGLDAGRYSDVIKTDEFNKVLAPNHFSYTDSMVTGFDIGLGAVYKYSGFSVGLGLSKLNNPKVNLFPIAVWEKVYEYDNGQVVDSSFQLADTNVVYKKPGFYSIQANINIMYEWELNEKVELVHSLQIGNFYFSNFDYLSFQNLMRYDERFVAGIGVFDNGDLGYSATLGATILNGFSLECSAFFSKDQNWDAALEEYVSDGLKPALELNARYHF